MYLTSLAMFTLSVAGALSAIYKTGTGCAPEAKPTAYIWQSAVCADAVSTAPTNIKMGSGVFFMI